MRQSKAGRVSEKHARRTNQELQALSEPPMNDPFEHLIAKTEFDSGVYDQISKAFTLILAGVAILFAGGSLAGVVLIDGAIIGIALSAGGAASLLIAIALSIELLFVAASTAGSARAGGGSLGTAIGVGAFVAVMMPIGAVLGAVVFAGVSAPVLIAGLGFGAAALLFTAVAELLVEAYEIKESTGTIAMAAGGFLLFLILMMLM